jgi:tetratricopeptide (TPR) repeat protein
MGDLYRALGQGEQAREAYLKSLQIAEQVAQAEPDRANYQRDLSVSYNKMGDVYRALGQGEPAREAYGKSLQIAERLAQAEPDRADYQRDLSVSYERMGLLSSTLGQGERAREAYGKSLQIRERLAQAEPDRADYRAAGPGRARPRRLPGGPCERAVQSRHWRRFVRARAHRAGARDPAGAPGSRTTCARA